MNLLRAGTWEDTTHATVWQSAEVTPRPMNDFSSVIKPRTKQRRHRHAGMISSSASITLLIILLALVLLGWAWRTAHHKEGHPHTPQHAQPVTTSLAVPSKS